MFFDLSLVLFLCSNRKFLIWHAQCLFYICNGRRRKVLYKQREHDSLEVQSTNRNKIKQQNVTLKRRSNEGIIVK